MWRQCDHQSQLPMPWLSHRDGLCPQTLSWNKACLRLLSSDLLSQPWDGWLIRPSTCSLQILSVSCLLILLQSGFFLYHCKKCFCPPFKRLISFQFSETSILQPLPWIFDDIAKASPSCYSHYIGVALPVAHFEDPPVLTHWSHLVAWL